MLVLSSKVKYCIAALLELVGSYEKGLLPSKVIAERRGIPQNYLEQLLNQLTKAGLVKALRGSKGGYELMVPPRDITFLQVLEALEGDLEMTKNNGEAKEAVRELYREAEQVIKDVFRISLAELAVRQQQLEAQAQESLMFHI